MGDRTIGGAVTSVNDPSVRLLGGTGEASSPHRLLVSTIPDELKMATRPSSSVRAPTASLSPRTLLRPAPLTP